MPKWRVLITDIAWPSPDLERQVLSPLGAELTLAQTASEAELLHMVPGSHAILTCWKQVPASAVRAGTELQVISRYGIGLDNIAVDEATRHGIIVANVPDYCLDEVSDHAMALLLACARKVSFFHDRVQSGDWDIAGGKPIYRLRGKTLGIIGLGRIGQALAAKAAGFGLHLLAYDPHVSAETAASCGCRKVDLDTLLAASDLLSIHAPLTDDTRNLIGADELRRMRHTAILVNTSRGALVDQDALVTALREGWIAGAGLDVFVPERIPADHPLLHMPNVVATPHVAFYSEESVQDLQVRAAQNVAAVLTGHLPHNVVNAQVLSLPRWAHLTEERP